jgi:hypoxia up-regulated 1
MVQAALKATFGEGLVRLVVISSSLLIWWSHRKIAHNVNADEAAVLGAAFYGASLSSRFKTKELKVQDKLSSPSDINLEYVAETKKGDSEP